MDAADSEGLTWGDTFSPMQLLGTEGQGFCSGCNTDCDDFGFEDADNDDIDEDDSVLSADEAAALEELQQSPFVVHRHGSNVTSGSAPQQLHLGSALFVLLSADSAALGLWRDGRLARHKVLTGYTVRRKQGGSQAAFEARGGRQNTAGAALRRRETRRLWRRCAERLDAWEGDVRGCHVLFQSGSVRNWGLLYSCTEPRPPVDRRDPRWRRLALSVPRPRFRSLLAALSHVSWGERRAYDP